MCYFIFIIFSYVIIIFKNTHFFQSKLNWMKSKNGDLVISCITNTEDVQLWHTTDSSPYITIPRDIINSSMNVI